MFDIVIWNCGVHEFVQHIVTCGGPNGRRYWHNLALGPPPWEDAESPRSRPGARQLDSLTWHTVRVTLCHLQAKHPKPRWEAERLDLPRRQRITKATKATKAKQRVKKISKHFDKYFDKFGKQISPHFATLHHWQYKTCTHENLKQSLSRFWGGIGDDWRWLEMTGDGRSFQGIASVVRRRWPSLLASCWPRQLGKMTGPGSRRPRLEIK